MGGLTLTATALAGMVLGCAVVGGVGQVAVGRAQVDAAADLAALAAAAHLARGDPGDVACGAASRVAGAPGGTVVGDGGGPGGDPAGPAASSGLQVVQCVPDGAEVTVEVVAPLRVLGLTASLVGRARAGPVPPG